MWSWILFILLFAKFIISNMGYFTNASASQEVVIAWGIAAVTQAHVIYLKNKLGLE